jgi:hypothetical protein
MGILDDAIREHLELKRKHGVPDEEVERQQEEALGPARREVAQQPEDAEIAAEQGTPAAAEDAAPTAVDDAALFDGEHTGPSAVEEPPVAEHEPALAEPPADEPPLAEPPVADHTGLEPAPLDDAHGAEPPAPDEPDEPDEPDAEPDPHDALGDTEPHGFPAVEEDEEDEEDEADEADEDDPDLLEDTPDFLQETPEHDRLWFEQKPPRDFDFD